MYDLCEDRRLPAPYGHRDHERTLVRILGTVSGETSSTPLPLYRYSGRGWGPPRLERESVWKREHAVSGVRADRSP